MHTWHVAGAGCVFGRQLVSKQAMQVVCRTLWGAHMSKMAKMQGESPEPFDNVRLGSLFCAVGAKLSASLGMPQGLSIMLGLTTLKGCQKIPVFPSHSLSVWLLHGLCTLASFNWGSATLPGAC